MPFSFDMFHHMSMKDIGELCKEHKIKSFTTMKLDDMLEKLNYVPDSDGSEKKARTRKCPKEQAKKHKGETMKGEDGNMYVSTEVNDKWTWKKTTSTKTSICDSDEEKVDNDESNVEETPVINEIIDDNDNSTDQDSEKPEPEIVVVVKEKKIKKEPKEGDKKDKKERQSPTEKAKDHKNERMNPVDGNWWESKPNKNDVYSWKKSA